MEHIADYGTLVFFKGLNKDGSNFYMISRTGYKAGPILDSPDREMATAMWDDIVMQERAGRAWIDNYLPRVLSS